MYRSGFDWSVRLPTTSFADSPMDESLASHIGKFACRESPATFGAIFRSCSKIGTKGGCHEISAAQTYQKAIELPRVITETLIDSSYCPNSAYDVPTCPAICASLPQGPVRHERRIPQPPSPPGSYGPDLLFRVRFNPPTLLGPALSRPFFMRAFCSVPGRERSLRSIRIACQQP